MATGFKGVSAGQDVRFSDKERKLLKSMKFPKEFDTKLDLRPVNWEAMKGWIAKRVTELLGIEDEVLIAYIFEQLEGKQTIDPRILQINLTGFLEKNTSLFVKELWSLLASASINPSGIPQPILDAKAEELRKKKEVQDRINEKLNQERAKREDEEREARKRDEEARAARRAEREKAERAEAETRRRAREQEQERQRAIERERAAAREQQWRERERQRDRDRDWDRDRERNRDRFRDGFRDRDRDRGPPGPPRDLRGDRFDRDDYARLQDRARDRGPGRPLENGVPSSRARDLHPGRAEGDRQAPDRGQEPRSPQQGQRDANRVSTTSVAAQDLREGELGEADAAEPAPEPMQLDTAEPSKKEKKEKHKKDKAEKKRHKKEKKEKKEKRQRQESPSSGSGDIATWDGGSDSPGTAKRPPPELDELRQKALERLQSKG